jgi:hypothetical protein
MSIALFDMDGTLFDFEGQMRLDLDKLMSPGESDPIKVSENYIGNLWEAEKVWSWLKARMDLIKMRPGWWRDLPQLAFGWDILRICQRIGFETQILTKGPSNKPHVWTEKVECVKKYPSLQSCVIHISEAKGQVYGKVLVDDFPDYIESWLEHRRRGLVIMPDNPSNAEFTHPNVIRYNGSNIDFVERALQAAFVRKPHQHWRDCLE